MLEDQEIRHIYKFDFDWIGLAIALSIIVWVFTECFFDTSSNTKRIERIEKQIGIEAQK